MSVIVNVKPSIAESINAFDELQTKLGKFGAWDTEPNGVFHHLIKLAVERKPFPERADINYWQLYEIPGARDAAKQLTASARRVYDAIRQDADHEDVERLKGFAWRVRFAS